MVYDRIVIGAGLYGLYAATFCAKRGESVLVLEADDAPFLRATYINQARVHQGYHYPRSISTALKSAGYFRRFNEDYGFCINSAFEQIYATSTKFSWSDGIQFANFCKDAGIRCEELNPNRYFVDGMCDGAFLTEEYTYDASILRDYFLDEISKLSSKVEIRYGIKIVSITRNSRDYILVDSNGSEYSSSFVLNTTYAGTNQILDMAGYDKYKIKYELCEIILCNVSESLKHIGFTVMDGPFFSIMPFGKTGLHSLTSVTFTPHETCYEDIPHFKCQEKSEGYCTTTYLGNCNLCIAKPATAYPYMSGLARKYLKEEYGFDYFKSLYSMKPILIDSEIDDSRPTVIRIDSDEPKFISVLSGKINTVYDLDEVLSDE